MSTFAWFLAITGVIVLLGLLSWIFDITGSNGNDA